MPETFIIRLKKALELRDMKPIELAEKSGLSKASISQYLNGVYEAKSKALYKLSTALNVNPAWLMGHDVPMEVNNSKFDNDYAVKMGDTEIIIEKQTFTQKNMNDIAQHMSSLIEQLNNVENALMFDGEPLDDESKELLKESLENSLKMGKMIAKNKFTPDKYKK
ncbi:MAG: helix-turn-helix domain-containing protein [Lachnotalea sp.]